MGSPTTIRRASAKVVEAARRHRKAYALYLADEGVQDPLQRAEQALLRATERYEEALTAQTKQGRQ